MPRTNPDRYVDPLRATRTIAETGRLIGCGAAKVSELICNNFLQAVRVGNRRLPTVASIETLLGKPIGELEGALRRPPEVTETSTQIPSSKDGPRV
jgi:hypothetical protein